MYRRSGPLCPGGREESTAIVVVQEDLKVAALPQAAPVRDTMTTIPSR